MTRLLLSIVILFPALVNAQYCVTGGPTSLNDSNIESVSLVGDSGAINYTGCPGILGVEEFFGQSVTLGANNNYSLDVQFGTCGGNYAGAGEAWIDYNQNGLFENSESLGTWSGTPPTSLSTFNFTVPSTAVSGQTRMRIIQQEQGSNPLDPCAGFNWGSVTDFIVEIQGGIDCSGYIGDDQSNPRPVTAYPYSESYSNAICFTNTNLVYNSPDVFYLLTDFSGLSSLTVSLCGSSFDTFLTVTDTQGNAIEINDDSPNCGSQSELVVMTDGHDSLYVIVEGWGSASGDYTLNIGEGQLSLPTIDQEYFSIFPNPAATSVFFEGKRGGTATLIDARGTIVKSFEISQKQEIDVSELATGIYTFKLETTTSVSTKKIMIK